MKITKYTFQGAVRHDVAYIADDAICRYAADEPEKPRLKKAYADVCELAADIAGFPVSIKRLPWGGNDKDTAITIEGDAATATERIMSVKLPKIGYRLLSAFSPLTNDLIEKIVPIDITEDQLLVIQELEKALCDYVQNGAGQLSLFDDNVRDFKTI